MTLSHQIIVANEADVLAVVRAENRHRDVSILRQSVVQHLLLQGLPINEIARIIERDRKSVQHAIVCHDNDIAYSEAYQIIYNALGRTLSI